jgi:hypothetical protein
MMLFIKKICTKIFAEITIIKKYDFLLEVAFLNNISQNKLFAIKIEKILAIFDLEMPY